MSVARCRTVNRYKVSGTVSSLSDDSKGCSLLTDPGSFEVTLQGYKYVLHVTPLFHICGRDRQKENPRSKVPSLSCEQLWKPAPPGL